MKEPLQIDCKKARNKHGYQHSAGIFIKNIFNQFHGTGLFLYFLKYIRKPEPKFSWWFQGTLKDTSAMKWVESHLIFSYLFCYLIKFLKIVYTTEKLLTEWNCSFSSSTTHGEFISYNVDKIAFILFNTSCGFYFQLQACITYWFHT